VTSQRLDIGRAGSNQFSLTFSNRASVENLLFSTTTNFYVPGLYTNLYVLTNFFYVTNITVSTNYTTNGTTITTNVVTTTNIPLQTLYETNIYTTNLTVWSIESLGIEVPNAPMTNTFYQTRNNDIGYFRLAQIIYTGIYVPKDLKNRTLTLNFDDDLGTIVIHFDNATGGTYTPPPGEPPGTIKSYTWSQDYFEGNLNPIKYSSILPMTLKFFFQDPSGGVFSGTVNSDGPYNVTGNFTLSPGS